MNFRFFKSMRFVGTFHRHVWRCSKRLRSNECRATLPLALGQNLPIGDLILTRNYIDHCQSPFRSDDAYLSLGQLTAISKTARQSELNADEAVTLGSGVGRLKRRHGLVVWKFRHDWSKITIGESAKLGTATAAEGSRETFIVNLISGNDKLLNGFQNLGVFLDHMRGLIHAG